MTTVLGTNVTVTGDAVVSEGGVVTFLPDCSRASYADVTVSGATQFDITDTDYITGQLIPVMIPGWVFGCLALIGFAIFLGWLRVICWRQGWCGSRCCRGRQGCCGRGKKTQPEEAAAPDQFIASSGASAPQPQTPPDLPVQPSPPAGSLAHRLTRPATLFKLALLAMTLAVVGVSAWGLADSIVSTNSLVSDFWAIEDEVHVKIDNAVNDLVILQDQVVQLYDQVSVIISKPSVFITILARLGVSSNVVNQAMAAIQSAPDSLNSVASSVDDGRSTLQDNIQEAIYDIEDNWYQPTMDIQDIWRFIPIAVLFGLMILIAGACGLLCMRLRWYRTAIFLTALLWLAVALLMLLGAGLLRGLYVGATDSCKYLETLLLELTSRKIANPRHRERVTNAFLYYFGITYIPDDRVVYELLGVPTYLLHELVEGPVGTLVLPILANPALVPIARVAGMTQQEATAFQNTSELIPAISPTVSRLEEQALKSSLDPLYHQAKEYICCGLSNEAHDVWVAWTVTGCLGFVLALMCSGRIVQRAMQARRQQKARSGLAEDGGGVLPPPLPEQQSEAEVSHFQAQPPPTTAYELSPAGPWTAAGGAGSRGMPHFAAAPLADQPPATYARE